MIKQRKILNSSFYKRIQEVTDAKTTLENHLNETIKEITSQESNMESLQKAIYEKTGPMQLSQTRLELRSYRPNNELVRDPVQYNLVDEVKEIEASVNQLQQRYVQSQTTLKNLNRKKLILEEDIAIKEKSLLIDQEQCMTLRKQMDKDN
jgi:chromosome segregation ATPase